MSNVIYLHLVFSSTVGTVLYQMFNQVNAVTSVQSSKTLQFSWGQASYT